MPQIFHHNLQDYSRTHDNLEAGYSYIRHWFPQRFIVAGFTEVLTPAAAEDLHGLAQALDPDLKRLVMIEVGQSAGGNRRGRLELVGIAWNPGEDGAPCVSVTHAGFVVRHGMLRHGCSVVKAEVPDQVVDGDRPTIIESDRTTNTVVDHRGIAFIAGTYAGRAFLFGFMHNVFTTGVRPVDFARVPAMVDAARKTLGAPYDRAEVIIGGDFNVPPHDPKPPRGESFMLHMRAAEGRHGFIPTTKKNSYDFFLVSNAAVRPNCVRVFPFTRRDRSKKKAASDHAAVFLDYVLGDVRI
ncbi:MAG TPA: endonuclease/exonuclease/phosphatase family protein [Longimicrobiales bacterium]